SPFKISTWVLLIQVDNSNQHQYTSQEGVHKKLKVDADTIFTAPQCTDEIDRYQSYFPSDIETECIQCREYKQQPRLHKEYQRIEISFVCLRKAGKDNQRDQDIGQ